MALFTKGPWIEALIKVINAGEALDDKYKMTEAYLEDKNFDGCLSTVYMTELELGKLNDRYAWDVPAACDATEELLEGGASPVPPPRSCVLPHALRCVRARHAVAYQGVRR